MEPRSKDRSYIEKPKWDLHCEFVSKILAIFQCRDAKIFKMCLN